MVGDLVGLHPEADHRLNILTREGTTAKLEWVSLKRTRH